MSALAGGHATGHSRNSEPDRGQVAASIAWIAVSAEDAPELLVTALAPVSTAVAAGLIFLALRRSDIPHR